MDNFPPPQPDQAGIDVDREIRESMRIIQQQRSMKLVGVIVGLVVALIVGSLAVYLAYGDTPEGKPDKNTLLVN